MWALENIFINIVYIQTFGEWLCVKPFSPEVLSAHFDNLKSHSHQKKTNNTRMNIFFGCLEGWGFDSVVSLIATAELSYNFGNKQWTIA